MNVLHLAAQISQVRIVDYLNKRTVLKDLVNQGIRKPPSMNGEGEKSQIATNYPPLKIEALEWGDTPLHIAARNKSFHMVISLLNIRGIKKEALNGAGLTAVDIARENTEYYESYEIIALLADYASKEKPFLYSAPKVSVQKYENAIEMVNKTYDARRDKELVVAVLLATMSFTAVFTIPGGFKTDIQKGETENLLGMPIFIGIESFKLFIIFDCMAFFLSLFVVLMWQMSTPLTTGDKVFFLVVNNLFVCASYAFTACGFVAAVYTMLAHKHQQLELFMFWASIIVGCSANLTFFYLAARFSVKLARFNCLRGVHPFLRDRLVHFVWFKLEKRGVLDFLRGIKTTFINFLYSYNLGKNGTAEITACQDCQIRLL
ncbi:hypothetical protein SUGI_0369830 [Cryptomeria japonica]|nr:hypothetical protein SUGI_0369830 [Cryptomeria japonica]